MTPSKDEAMWKQRFERLAQAMDDLKYTIANEGFERCESRAWEPMDQVFVSFGLDVCDSEDKAIELYGEGNYDVYRLERLAPEPQANNELRKGVSDVAPNPR